MTSFLSSPLPEESTLAIPCNNAPNQEFQTKSLATIVGNGGKIYQTLFVDAVNYASSGADGSILRPFQTLQAAVTYADAQGWDGVQLLVAPASYAGAVAVPLGINVICSGWDPTGTNEPILGGSWTVTSDAGPGTLVQFTNCVITAASIATANPANQNLRLGLEHAECGANLSAFNLTLTQKQSRLTGNILATNDVETYWDGPSWSYWMQAPTIFPVSTQYYYRDAGHDVLRVQLDATVATGAVGFTSIAIPYCRAGDYVSVQFEDSTLTDIRIGVQGSYFAGGQADLWVENLTRVSSTIDDFILVIVHHSAMVSEPTTTLAAMAKVDAHAFDSDVAKLISEG